jgi:hypothetical protein
VERPLDMDECALTAYNKMHACYCVKVEWDIGGLNCNFWRLTKRFDITKPKNNRLFWAVAIMTNFIHRRRMDFAHYVVSEQPKPTQDYGWEGDYLVWAVGIPTIISRGELFIPHIN